MFFFTSFLAPPVPLTHFLLIVPSLLLSFVMNCVYGLGVRAWFDSFFDKCLKRCESFNDWIEEGIKEQLEIL